MKPITIDKTANSADVFGTRTVDDGLECSQEMVSFDVSMVELPREVIFREDN